MSDSATPAAAVIKTGDIVRLKTGGPRMTVDQVSDATATAVYFDTFDKLVKVELALGSLVREETTA